MAPPPDILHGTAYRSAYLLAPTQNQVYSSPIRRGFHHEHGLCLDLNPGAMLNRPLLATYLYPDHEIQLFHANVTTQYAAHPRSPAQHSGWISTSEHRLLSVVPLRPRIRSMHRSLYRSLFTLRQPDLNQNQTTKASSPGSRRTCLLGLPSNLGHARISRHEPFKFSTNRSPATSELSRFKTAHRALISEHCANRRDERDFTHRGSTSQQRPIYLVRCVLRVLLRSIRATG